MAGYHIRVTDAPIKYVHCFNMQTLSNFFNTNKRYFPIFFWMNKYQIGIQAARGSRLQKNKQTKYTV